jgi:hypothetical protein
LPTDNEQVGPLSNACRFIDFPKSRPTGRQKH